MRCSLRSAMSDLSNHVNTTLNDGNSAISKINGLIDKSKDASGVPQVTIPDVINITDLKTQLKQLDGNSATLNKYLSQNPFQPDDKTKLQV